MLKFHLASNHVQIVIADETLRQLTGEERFKAFSFNGLIKEHFLGYAD